MSQNKTPPIWLLVLLGGLSLLSETVYTPSLPSITRDLRTIPSMVEYTLTIYLIGFAIGTFVWGKISDHTGRKPCMILGLLLFVLGCLGCYSSTSILMLMTSRLIQSLGASVGSVIVQAICRDAFHGPALMKVYVTIGAALGVFPAIGPTVGGYITQYTTWNNIFLFLTACALVLLGGSFFLLPETYHKQQQQAFPVIEVFSKLLKDKKVLACTILVGGWNGIAFSYYAEGPFYLIKLLGLSPSLYGMTFFGIAGSIMTAGILSRRWHHSCSFQQIVDRGIGIVVGATLLFSLVIFLHTFIPMPPSFLITITLSCQMAATLGGYVFSFNALAAALTNYKWCVGTASSLFGFFYYVIISLLTLGMGALHNGTLLPMPLYFLGISLVMLLVRPLLKEGDEVVTK